MRVLRLSPTQWRTLVNVFGYILAISYPLLAFSAAGRSIYQLFFKGSPEFDIGPWTSAFAACCYLIAAFGLGYRRRWTWFLSISVLALETTGTLIVGTISVIDPQFIGSSVWRAFGLDFAFFPLLQPFLGMLWLMWPTTRTLYGFGP